MPILLFIIVVLAIMLFLIIGKYNRRIKSLNRKEIEDSLARRERKVRVAIKVPSGENRIEVYTYDGKPLEDRSPMSELILVVLPWREIMQSVYTGNTWSGYGCVSYDGKPVGFVSAYNPYFDVLAALTQKYGAVTVHARVDGYDSRYGCPRIELKLPDSSYFNRFLQ